MGVYTVKCKTCDKQFLWFSGNLDKRCSKCKNPTPAKGSIDAESPPAQTLEQVQETWNKAKNMPPIINVENNLK